MYVNINTQQVSDTMPPVEDGWLLWDEIIPEVPVGMEVLSSRYVRSSADPTKASLEHTNGSIAERLEREKTADDMTHPNWVQLGTQNSTVPDKIGDTYNPTSSYLFMLNNGWRDLVNTTMPPTPEGCELLSWTYEQDPDDPESAIIAPVFGLIADRLAKEALDENLYQSRKSTMLKTLENLYIQFLTTEWTPILRVKGLIDQSFTVTVNNTTEEQNVMHLLTIKALGDRDNYSYYSNEFIKYKFMIESRGGDMARIVLHNDI